MTTAEIEKLEAGDAMDITVAQALGWLTFDDIRRAYPWPEKPILLSGRAGVPDSKRARWDLDDITGIPRFSTDIAAAMVIVDAWEGDFDLRRQNGQHRATFFNPSEEDEAWAETAALAICRARLRAANRHGGAP